MQKPICSVYDRKIGAFENPFVARHTGEALRDWDNIRKDDKTRFGKNPEDFELYQIGVYNELTGSLENVQPHIQLSSGI